MRSCNDARFTCGNCVLLGITSEIVGGYVRGVSSLLHGEKYVRDCGETQGIESINLERSNRVLQTEQFTAIVLHEVGGCAGFIETGTAWIDSETQ